MSDNTNLPDNLKSRLSRFYVEKNEFKNDAGEAVAYKRLVVEIMVKDEPVKIELKADKKDYILLALADVVDKAEA